MAKSRTSPEPRIRADGRSPCPIAGALDLIGDKWTLLIVRDMLFMDKRRYGEFAASPEAIPTNILAERLKRLERHGLIEARAYQQRPLRHEYHLTPRGKALMPVLREIVRWGGEHIDGAHRPTPAQMRAAADLARRA